MRIRSARTKAWRAAHLEPYTYGGQGRGALRAAWAQAFRAEAAKMRGRACAASLLDLEKAFEKLPHDKIVAAAVKHEYCLTTLRLSLAAYRMRRSVVVDGACSRTVIATCGIAAVSGYATDKLLCLNG